MPTVLVVDDEETILELLSYNLAQEGFKVKTALNGDEALQIVRSEIPDLLILDWMLPDLSGLEICKIMRSQIETIDLPIIMLTAKGDEIDKILGLEMGANDYVTKPFSPRELTARVNAQLRAKNTCCMAQRENCTTLNQCGLCLDAEKYEARKEGKVIADLSPKEFELLFLLASNPGRIFRREEILKKIWGYDYPTDTRTVDVHIRYIRQKIRDNGKDGLLLTVRGVGYKFRECS